MKQNNFFANAASKALALAAAVMMSLAFAACGSDNNDDGGGKTPDTPEPKAQTVTLDGKEKPIVAAEYEDGTSGNYSLYLYLSSDRKERVEFQLNKDLHMTGKPIDLTKKEKEHDGKWYWVADYHNPDNSLFTNTHGGPDSNSDLYLTGTLTVTGDPATGITIKLENGRVKGTDGKEHTITLSYSGKMTKAGSTPEPPQPEPKANTVTLDGTEKPIVNAEYKDEGSGDYSLYLYLSADRQEKVIVFLNKDLHMTGSPVDLTKQEKEHEGKFYWTVNYYGADGKRIIDTWGKPGSSYPVFTTGTLTMSGDPTGTINIKLENGRVKGKDSKEHTITLSYSGKMTKAGSTPEPPTPTPTADTVTFDGTEKPIVNAEYENYSAVNYRLFLYLSVDRKEKVILYLNKDLHMTGKPIDLTKKEAKHVGCYWAVEYYDADGKRIIDTWGKPSSKNPVFNTGTLTMSGSPESTLNIKLENGRVKGNDDKEHTITLNYNDKMTKKE